MKPDDQNLERILRFLRIPTSHEKVRERAKYRAMAAYRNAPLVEKRRGRFPGWLLLAASTAFIILTAIIAYPGYAPCTDNLTVFSEIENMFPGQLVAAVKDSRSLDLQLAETPEQTPKDQRILITLRKNSRLVEVLTYSGCTARLKLDGHTMEVTPLVSGDGSVLIVSGDHLVKDFDATRIDGFLIHARTLAGGHS
jgi:hypothetical protein